MTPNDTAMADVTDVVPDRTLMNEGQVKRDMRATSNTHMHIHLHAHIDACINIVTNIHLPLLSTLAVPSSLRDMRLF